MDSSRRAVESYWRSRMVDGATADDDKVTPVYKLEEICELLRTSHASIVKEVSELIIKRLDHKSPIVKQKALKLVKYSVGKSGADFKREMQRHSAAFRQLLHYKGNLDPLKGDAINKAVRDTSQEAISILFSSEESKSANPAESINNRIEGFGNTNYEEKVEEKKSFLSEVVGLGSASIIQGLTSLAASHSSKKIDGGTYKSPNLRRSLTTEIEGIDRYEPVDEYHGEKWHPMGSSRTAVSGSRNSDSRNILASSVYEQNSSNPVAIRSREERLLETIVTSGGVRLQPTRDALHTFMVEASKMDPLVLSRAIEMKLQSHVWQVRMKAICVLESIIRKKDEDFCAIIESYFSENNDTVVKCCELPQASLREKANKVLTLLGAEHNSTAGNEDDPTDVKAPTALTIEIPDLIDTGGPDDDDPKNSNKNPVDQSIEDLSTAPLFDDLFEDPISNVSVGKNKNEDDPFADVSFHGSTDEKHSDIFSGLAIDDKKSDQISLAGNNTEFDIFGSSSWHAQVDVKKAQVLNGSAILDGGRQRSQLPSNGMSNGTFGLNSYYPMAAMQHSLQPSVMFNPALAAQPMSYGSMEAYIAQQQLLYQNIANINSGYINATGILTDESYSSALPDIFHLSTNPVQNHSTVMMASLKKDETKAFDFISEHMSSARDSKRIR